MSQDYEYGLPPTTITRDSLRKVKRLNLVASHIKEAVEGVYVLNENRTKKKKVVIDLQKSMIMSGSRVKLFEEYSVDSEAKL